MTVLDIVILEDGTLVVPWDDALDLAALGEILDVPRVSHVEYEPAAGGWTVRHVHTCAPMVTQPSADQREAPIKAFARRQEALAAEAAYVQAHLAELAQVLRTANRPLALLAAGAGHDPHRPTGGA